MTPAPHQRSPRSERVSSSTMLLILGGLCLLALPLMLLWPQPPAAHGPVSVTLQAGSTETADGGDALKLDALAASVEREPIAASDDAADLDWIVIPGQAQPASGDLAGLEDLDLSALADLGLDLSALEALGQATAAPPHTTGAAGDNDPVAAYLQEMDFALMSGGFWQDPQKLGMQVVQELMGGDASGLETLQGSNAAVMARIKAIQPPPGCEEHHQQTLKVIQAGNALLAGWSGAIKEGDISAIAEATADAEALRRAAARVDALTEQLQGR